jgi:hypothetical protein
MELPLVVFCDLCFAVYLLQFLVIILNIKSYGVNNIKFILKSTAVVSILWLLTLKQLASEALIISNTNTLSILSCVTFWVVFRRMVFNSRRFGTLCLFHLYRRVDASAIKHHTPENNPKGYTRHTEHGESLKSRSSFLDL